MNFADTTARQLRIPHGTIRRGVHSLMRQLHLHANPADLQTLTEKVPELAEELATPTRTGALASRLTRKLLARLRGPQHHLRATGLGNADVSFVSAFTHFLRQHLHPETVQRLIAAVPGLAAMSDWPLTPYRPSQIDVARMP